MKKWTKEELIRLNNLNSLELTKDEITDLFPDRTYDSISKKARTLKIKWKINLILERSWTENEKQILLNNFNTPNISMLINRTDSAIQQQLNKMGLILRNRPWLPSEDSYLIKNYYNKSINSLTTELNRTWESIKIRASKLCLKRSNEFSQKSNLSKLLNGSNESFYWLGFLMADGHFNFNDKRISLTLAIKDLEHITKYCNFIETKNISINENVEFPRVGVSTQNVVLFLDITKLIGIEDSNKTLTPNSLINLNIDNAPMMSLIIGFIDGDGHIRKQTNRNDYVLQLHLHRNWLENLYFIEEFIYEYFNQPKIKTLSKIGNDGYSRLHITNNTLLKKLKSETIKLELPVLDRKWNIINENSISNKEQIKLDKIKIIELYQNGFTPVNIIKNHTFTKSLVYKTIKELQ